MRALLAHRWPGNVRELENALEFATTVCEGQTIHVGDLPVEIGPGRTGDTRSDTGRLGMSSGVDEVPPAAIRNPAPASLPDFDLSPLEADEVARIRHALEQSRYRRGEAADLLGMSRSTLWRKMKQYRM